MPKKNTPGCVCCACSIFEYFNSPQDELDRFAENVTYTGGLFGGTIASGETLTFQKLIEPKHETFRFRTEFSGTAAPPSECLSFPYDAGEGTTQFWNVNTSTVGGGTFDIRHTFIIDQQFESEDAFKTGLLGSQVTRAYNNGPSLTIAPIGSMSGARKLVTVVENDVTWQSFWNTMDYTTSDPSFSTTPIVTTSLTEFCPSGTLGIPPTYVWEFEGGPDDVDDFPAEIEIQCVGVPVKTSGSYDVLFELVFEPKQQNNSYGCFWTNYQGDTTQFSIFNAGTYPNSEEYVHVVKQNNQTLDPNGTYSIMMDDFGGGQGGINFKSMKMTVWEDVLYPPEGGTEDVRPLEFTVDCKDVDGDGWSVQQRIVDIPRCRQSPLNDTEYNAKYASQRIMQQKGSDVYVDQGYTATNYFDESYYLQDYQDFWWTKAASGPQPFDEFGNAIESYDTIVDIAAWEEEYGDAEYKWKETLIYTDSSSGEPTNASRIADWTRPTGDMTISITNDGEDDFAVDHALAESIKGLRYENEHNCPDETKALIADLPAIGVDGESWYVNETLTWWVYDQEEDPPWRDTKNKAIKHRCEPIDPPCFDAGKYLRSLAVDIEIDGYDWDDKPTSGNNMICDGWMSTYCIDDPPIIDCALDSPPYKKDYQEGEYDIPTRNIDYVVTWSLVNQTLSQSTFRAKFAQFGQNASFPANEPLMKYECEDYVIDLCNIPSDFVLVAKDALCTQTPFPPTVQFRVKLFDPESR